MTLCLKHDFQGIILKSFYVINYLGGILNLWLNFPAACMPTR